MAWTSSTGRSHFDHRAALVFRDAAELRARLEALAEESDLPRSDEDSGRSGSRTALEAVAAAYQAGEQVSFAELFAGEKRRRIAIPSYPFQRRSFWIQARK